VKRQLNESSFVNVDDRFTAVHHILDGSDRPTFIIAFEELLRRLRLFIEIKAEYVK
jgi:hypothetical protein